MHKLGATSALFAAWYAASASAADYNTQIYSVKIDAQNRLLQIEGVDLAPGGAPSGASVQLLGQTLSIHEAASSSTHLEAAFPDSLSLEPETSYQLYVSPDRARTASGSASADQALFTLYVGSRVEGAKTTTVVGGGQGNSSGTAASGGGAKSYSSNVFNSLGSAFSLNSHQTGSIGNGAAITNSGATTNNGSTFSLPYTGSLASTSTLFSLTNTSSGDAIDAISTSGDGLKAESTSGIGMLGFSSNYI
ncbi:MAG: hypothetical protein JOY51_06310, partial [Nevskia sp.]|nr:hypothetical protein [Nevskia sp.]